MGLQSKRFEKIECDKIFQIAKKSKSLMNFSRKNLDKIT
jgi:hypothetical protein